MRLSLTIIFYVYCNDESTNTVFCGDVCDEYGGDVKYEVFLIWHISKGLPGATLKPVPGKTPKKWFESIFLFLYIFLYFWILKHSIFFFE